MRIPTSGPQQHASLCRREMALSLLRIESCWARTSPRSCACRATMDSTLRPSSSSAWALLFFRASSSAADLLSCCPSSLWKLRTRCSHWQQRHLPFEGVLFLRSRLGRLPSGFRE